LIIFLHIIKCFPFIGLMDKKCVICEAGKESVYLIEVEVSLQRVTWRLNWLRLKIRFVSFRHQKNKHKKIVLQ
jgi:hypothetical protein